MWIAFSVIFVLAVIGIRVAYTAGRAKGFEDCWRQYVQPKWDKMEKEL